MGKSVPSKVKSWPVALENFKGMKASQPGWGCFIAFQKKDKFRS